MKTKCGRGQFKVKGGEEKKTAKSTKRGKRRRVLAASETVSQSVSLPDSQRGSSKK